jgi:hypothetical protein
VWVEKPLKKIYFKFGSRNRLGEEGEGEGAPEGHDCSRGLGELRRRWSGEGRRGGYESSRDWVD